MKNDNYASLKEKNRHYFDHWAKSYDHFIFGWWVRYIQRKLMEELKLDNKTKVLDVGCGTGYLLLQLSSKIKIGKIIVIDISPKMLKEAQKKVNNIRNVKLRRAEAERLPFPDNTFDYVLSA